jgi:hypothetical protein
VSIQAGNLIEGVTKAMLLKKLGVAAAVVVGLGATGTSLAPGQTSAAGGRAWPEAPKPKSLRLPPQAALLYDHIMVREQKPGEQNWRRIPWLTDFAEGLRQAKAESRPILLWLSDGPPMDRC